MLACPNPVVVPAWADPICWLVGVLCLGLEVGLLLAVARRAGCRVREIEGRLALLQLVSWGGFLMAVDALHDPALIGVVGIELGVVLLEATVLVSMLGGPLRAGGRRPWAFCLWWSLVANATSVVVCAGVVSLLWLRAR